VSGNESKTYKTKDIEEHTITNSLVMMWNFFTDITKNIRFLYLLASNQCEKIRITNTLLYGATKFASNRYDKI